MSDLPDLDDIPSLGDLPSEDESPVRVEVSGQAPPKQRYDAKTRTLTLENEDGSAVVLMNQDPPKPEGSDEDPEWTANLAEQIDEGERGRIVTELMEAVDADDRSREEWLRTRAKGIEMLGFRLEEPRSEAGFSSGPMEGMSVVRHPVLAESVIRFQANASAELYPPEGPVKVYSDAPPLPTGMMNDPDMTGVNTADDLAEALERDFNHYLTVTDKEYRSDCVRMLFSVGFGGCAFRKVYFDPIKRRPISRTVDAKDLIVSNEIVGLEDAGRITHRVSMRQAVMRRMQIAGVYRDTKLYEPGYQEPNEIDRAVQQAQGFASEKQRPEDQPYIVDEIYCELDLKGFEHKEDGEATGLPLPYKVSIERTTRTLLELRRNWAEDDDTYTPKRVFVKYGFVSALGFYDIGLLNILGNADRALTAGWREMLDAGMFSCFPGLLVSDAVGRQFSNQIRIPPGGAQVLKTNGQPIQNVVQAMPYREPGIPMMQLIQHIEQVAQRIGGIGEMPVGEGRTDAPVGTTLALIEQATKIIAAVHVGLHASQAEEFQLLRELFLEDPESFWRHNKRPAKQWEVDQFLEAIENVHIVPVADPNMPTHLHRIMKATALKQLQAMNPGLYDAKAVDSRILRMIGFADPEELFAPPGSMPPMGMGAPPPDPTKVAALQLKAQQQQADHAAKMIQMQQDAQDKQREDAVKMQLAGVESHDRAADRESRSQLGDQRVQLEQMKLQDEAQRQARQHQNDQVEAMLKAQQQSQQQHATQQHEAQQAQIQRQHEAQQNTVQQQHEAHQGGLQMAQSADLAQQQHEHASDLAEEQRKHDAEQKEKERKSRPKPTAAKPAGKKKSD